MFFCLTFPSYFHLIFFRFMSDKVDVTLFLMQVFRREQPSILSMRQNENQLPINEK